MAVYIVTGKLGGGKSLLSVRRIQETLHSGLPVATNLDLRLHKIVGKRARNTRVIRIPDKPAITDFQAMGIGNRGYDESLNGLLVLDECGTWFNSRNWNDPSRKHLNDWFFHARKLGWDVILIIQDVSLLDSQARSAIAEHTAFCKRLDRVGIPVISTFFKAITGYRLTLPRLHVARVVYGIRPDDLVVDRWATRGDDLHTAYDTKQIFLDDYPHGTYSILPPWHTHGRHMAKRNWRYIMRITRIFWRRFKSPLAFGTGLLIGVSMIITLIFSTTNYDTDVIPFSQDSPDSTLTATSNLSPITDPVLFKLTSATIDAYIRLDDRAQTVYRFKVPSTSSAGTDLPEYYFLSTDLEAMGYQVTPLSRCLATVSKGPESLQIHCF